MKKILLDTNFLISAVIFKIDIFSEIRRICDFSYELCIIDKVIDELNEIAEKGVPEERAAARISIQLIKKKSITIIKTPEKNKRVKNVDLLILERVNKGNFIVATQDRELKSLIREKGVPIIVLRQKKYLKMFI